LGARAAAGALQGADDDLQLGGEHSCALLHRVGGAERPLAGAHLLLGLMRERGVDEPQERVVLPHTEAERDSQRHQRHDQPRAQLLEMADYRELLVAAYVSNGYSHCARSGPIAGDTQAADGACGSLAGGIADEAAVEGSGAGTLARAGGDAGAELSRCRALS